MKVLPTEEEIFEVLKAVYDPEIGVDVVNMGLVYGAQPNDGNVVVKMTLTSIGCPAVGMLEFQAREAVGTLDGVESVTIEWVFDPPWSQEKMTEEGRDQLAAMGYW